MLRRVMTGGMQSENPHFIAECLNSNKEEESEMVSYGEKTLMAWIKNCDKDAKR